MTLFSVFAGASSAQPSGLLEDATPSDGEVVPISGFLPAADERYKGIKVLVVGAGGGVGKAVCSQLSAQGIPVRAFVRDAVRASSSLPSAAQGVELIEGDVYKYETVARALGGGGFTAVINASGPTDRFNPLAPFQVDYQGTQNLVAAAAQAGVQKFVQVSSIGADDPLFPLNAFWGVLFWKKQGELAVQRSGLDYTIIRPGGLLNAPRTGKGEAHVVVAGPDSFGLPPRRMPGSVLRSQVAEGCVAALVEPAATNKILEVVSEVGATSRPWAELFASVY